MTEHEGQVRGRPRSGSHARTRTSDVRLLDLAPPERRVLDLVVEGLSRRPRSLPCTLLYDAEGSRLFDRICELPEYYVSRVESALLERLGHELARLAGENVEVLELGCGSASKTELLLAALRCPAAYRALDISREALLAATRRLAAAHPRLEVWAICADFDSTFELPRGGGPPRKCLGFFPGSTIGNFSPEAARRLLRRIACHLGPGGDLIVGVDLPKDPAVLEAAYDDAQGVTAAFNKNLLARLVRELGAEVDLDAFSHLARFDRAEGRVEMHLVSAREQVVTIGQHRFHFAAGERIHTESSYKYDVPVFRRLAEEAGYVPLAAWTDPDRLFSIHYLRLGG